MKCIALLCVVAVTYSMAAPSVAEMEARKTAPALQHEEIHDKFGQFVFRYVTADGTIVMMRGKLVPDEEGNMVLVYEGESSYIGPDGRPYITKYTAGLDGFQVQGDHLPKAPEPVPA